MATFVFVHGAWHGGWCWHDVASRLALAGHVARDLPGMSEATCAGAGGVRLQDHIDSVVAEIDCLAAKPYILVAHSYGGMIARAIEFLRPDGLVHVVYIEANVPLPGQSLFDTMQTGVVEAVAELGFNAESGPVFMPPDVGTRYEISDPDLAARVQSRLRPQPLHTLTDPLPMVYAARQGRLRRTYIYATDRAPNPYRSFVDRFAADRHWNVVGLSGGHEMMLTNPSDLANVLHDASDDSAV